ncbi:MAG: carbohydrate kinase family protein [Lachnospiraceae bacterium]|nr:carbohydrate kinase family protein [Lachnospiraceae bacterium]
MNKFLVAGIVQRETIVKVDQIPVEYASITSQPNTIDISIGGDAYNESLALEWLGNDVDFMTMIGKHDSPDMINPYGSEVLLRTDYVLPRLSQTPTEVVLCGPDRKQQVFEDVKDVPETEYDLALFEERVGRAGMVVLSNENFCRPLLRLAKEAGKPIAVNIRDHMSGEGSGYDDEEFLKTADILYMSDDILTEDPYDYVKGIVDRYAPKIVLLGLGAKGVLLYSKEDEIFAPFPTVKTNKIVNTVGAGNALFSSFLHYYFKTGNAVAAVKNAILFASYKIGFMGTSNGFMTEEQIEQWHSLIWKDGGNL